MNAHERWRGDQCDQIFEPKFAQFVPKWFESLPDSLTLRAIQLSPDNFVQSQALGALKITLLRPKMTLKISPNS